MAATLTPDERATLKGLISDPVAYIENMLWIRDMDDRIVRLKLNRAQWRVLAPKQKAIEEGEPQRLIFLKARPRGPTGRAKAPGRVSVDI